MSELVFGLDVENIDVGEFAPKPTTLTEGQTEASVSIYSNDTIDVGIWECTPGRFTADRTKTAETCYIISGRIEMTKSDGSKQILTKGDSIVLPKGWVGEWNILEKTRKLYVITQ